MVTHSVQAESNKQNRRTEPKVFTCDFGDCENHKIRFTVNDKMMYQTLRFCSLVHLLKHYMMDDRVKFAWAPRESGEAEA